MKVEGVEQNGFSSLGMNGNHTVVEEEVERSSPYLGEADVRPRLNKKKSGTFWGRRKSSFGMPLEEAAPVELSREETNGSVAATGDYLDTRTSGGTSLQEEERPRSPPPQLPEVNVIYDGGSLGVEDIFRKIG